ncbi:MAG: magnesium/cobalt transporter CorA [Candidatus Zixiibacteriota bacterium]|nr:MAG: magnesium/cobalt transporter CorA [candidate division Zixibacteria bacterium]
MARLVRRAKKKLGLKPGAVVYVGEKRTEPVEITVIDYDQTEFREMKAKSVEDCFPFRDSSTITWINVTGLHDVEVIEKLGAHFNLSSLVLEDIVNTGHRPKMEETESILFIMLKMLYTKTENHDIISEHVGVVFGKNFVISFQEKPGDVLDVVRERIKRTVPRVRFTTAGYLAYALIDAIVDHYFVVLESIGERVESLEEELISNPVSRHLDTIHSLKRELIYIRRAVWPLREVVGGLERTETDLISDDLSPYLRDLYEHTIQVIDTVETFRDMVSGLLDIYLSSVSNRMNEVMKVLTIIATIFIPLGFLAGVYGMNFDTSVSPFNLPELGMRYGYPAFWLAVLIVGGGLFWFFRRKHWL